MWGILHSDQLHCSSRLRHKACIAYRSPNHCQELRPIVQSPLRHNPDTMDRALDRSLDDILEDRKQVCPASSFPLFLMRNPSHKHHPVGRLSDSRGCRATTTTATEVLAVVAAVAATGPTIPEMAPERYVRAHSPEMPAYSPRSKSTVTQIRRRRATTR